MGRMKRLFVDVPDGVAQHPTLGIVAQIRHAGVIQVIGLAELVQQPDHLAGVRDEIHREPQRDHPVDIGDAQVAGDEHLVHEALPRIPRKRDPHFFGFVPGDEQLTDEMPRQLFRTATDKRHSGVQNEYLHASNCPMTVSQSMPSSRMRSFAASPIRAVFCLSR